MVGSVNREALPTRTLRPVLCDVGSSESRLACVQQVLGHSAELQRICIVDAALDRATVQRMRASISGATSLATHLLSEAAALGVHSELVACSTTAVLAPNWLATPYGRFKRVQLETYATSGYPVSLLLLPNLVLQVGGSARNTRSSPIGYEL
jgi:hypothetical protein